ncbi:unnamed protein product [Ectocarpus sp. 12 AP-2014]
MHDRSDSPRPLQTTHPAWHTLPSEIGREKEKTEGEDRTREKLVHSDSNQRGVIRKTMLRTAGRAIHQQCRQRGPQAWTPLCVRHFSAGGGDRLVELSTKDEYVNFPREKSVLYFTAKWCPPCRRIGPFLAELSEETPAVSFGKVDIDDNEEAAQMAHIKSVPTFKFFKASKQQQQQQQQLRQEIDTMSGADANLLEQNVAKLAEA